MKIKKLPSSLLPVMVFSMILTSSYSQVADFSYRIFAEDVILHQHITDIDRDGSNDLVGAANYVEKGDEIFNLKKIVWYGGPDFKEHLIARMMYNACEMNIADIDGDGYTDIVGMTETDTIRPEGIDIDLNNNSKFFWLRNPGKDLSVTNESWQLTVTGKGNYAKDISSGDFNLDGLMDIAGRSLDGKLHLMFQQKKNSWKQITIDIPTHDGTAVSDIDRDRDPDIILNGFWLENPGKNAMNPKAWIKHDYDPAWYSMKTGESGSFHWSDNNCKVNSADFNRDGYVDIIISNGEKEGWPVTWYENPGSDSKTGWQKHIVGVHDFAHTLKTGDINNDGEPDLVTGTFLLSEDSMSLKPAPVAVYYNLGKGEKWKKQVISLNGMYDGNIGDIDNDGDIDITGNITYYKPPFQVWINQTGDSKLPLDKWKYICADSTRQKWGDFEKPEWLRYFGFDTYDINNDGNKEILSGRYLYINPGKDMTSAWRIKDLGKNVDGYLFADIDDDSNTDIIASALPALYWVEANDSTFSSFTFKQVASLEVTGHVNGQGYTLAQIIPGGKPEIVLSTGKGAFYFEIPEKPESVPWKPIRITQFAHEEDIAPADINGDGLIDAVMGWTNSLETIHNVYWYENPGGAHTEDWKQHFIGNVKRYSDRLRAADLNGDGFKDVAVTEEIWPGYEPDASLWWFENPGITGREWKAHTIATNYSMNSIDAADLDRDGDIDLVTNEHKGSLHRTFIYINDGKGNFTPLVAGIGKEMHLGARLSDLDSDGDLDIAGPAWDNWKYLHIFRNDALKKGVKISDNHYDEGQECYRISTPYATFYYQKEAGGFSSILDNCGVDWINYRNSGKTEYPKSANSDYRGIPNMMSSSDDGGIGHPGFRSCVSKVLNDSIIHTVSKKGDYEYTWTFTERYAYITVLKIDTARGHWFLYEGTPGGKWDPENIFWGNNRDGIRSDKPDIATDPVLDNWNWVIFGSRLSGNTLFLVKQFPDNLTDHFAFMGDNENGIRDRDGMIVFGFARNKQALMKKAGAVYYLGFENMNILNPEIIQTVNRTCEKISQRLIIR